MHVKVQLQLQHTPLLVLLRLVRSLFTAGRVARLFAARPNEPFRMIPTVRLRIDWAMAAFIVVRPLLFIDL
jgi:hypothetical protein